MTARPIGAAALAAMVCLACTHVAASCFAAEPPTDEQSATTVDLYGDQLPPGAIARLGTTRFRLQNSVSHAAFSAEGKTLCVVTYAGRLNHYDAANGKLLRSIPFLTANQQVRKCTATADGKWLAVLVNDRDEAGRARTDSLLVVDLADGSHKTNVLVTELISDSDLAISPSGDTIAAVTLDHIVCLWDTAAGVKSHQYALEQRGDVSAITFSPDSQTLALGGRDWVYLWDWVTEQAPRVFSIAAPARRRDVASLAFSPDGATLAAGIYGHDSVVLLDPANGALMHTLPQFGALNYNVVSDLVFSPDGRRLATIRNHNNGPAVLWWDAKTWQLAHTFELGVNYAGKIAVSPRGAKLAAFSFGSGPHVWDLQSHDAIPAGQPAHGVAPEFVEFLPGDKQLASASHDGTIGVWDAQTGRNLRTMKHVEEDDQRMSIGRLCGFDVSPDGRYAVSSSMEDTVRMWRIDDGRMIYRLPGHGRSGRFCGAVKFSSDSATFASWGMDMRMYVWDVATGKARQEYLLQPSQGQPTPLDPFAAPTGGLRLRASVFSPDARFFALAFDSLIFFDTTSGQELRNYAVPSGAAALVEIAPDNQSFVVCRTLPVVQTEQGGYVRRNQYEITMFRCRDGEQLWQTQMVGQYPQAVAISPDGAYLAACSRHEQPIRIFRAVDGAELATIAPGEIQAKSLAFSHDNKLLATGMANGNVLIWKLDEFLKVSQTKSQSAEDTK